MPQKIAPKVIVLSLFEPSNQMPGEQKLFTDRLGFTERFIIPGAMGDLFYRSDGVGALLLGIGATKPAISLMALGYDERFDLRNTYFLIAGIAGADPHAASLASVAWARFVVDGNLAFDIDAREIPPDWPTGIFPLGANKPYEMPYRGDDGVFLKDEVFELNAGLMAWGFELTRNLELQDSEEMAASRAIYSKTPKALEPPFVLKGDVLATERFWHGRYHNEWAQRWVELWTGGQGTFVMSNMDDMGALRGLNTLAAQGKVDFSRIMLIRSASNFCMQPPGKTAMENLASEESEEDRYPGYLPSLENLYRVGERVVFALISGWQRFEKRAPGF